MQVKDGVSWTALEYFKWLQGPEGQKVSQQKELVIVPASIVYTDKSRYRSSVVVKYGEAINVAEYAQQFLSTEEGESKKAVKKLTRDVGISLIQMTVNAKDWYSEPSLRCSNNITYYLFVSCRDTLCSAKMARRILWQDERSIRLEDWVDIYQTYGLPLSLQIFSRSLQNAKQLGRLI